MTSVCDRIADAVLRGAGATELATIFAQMIGKTVLLLDPEFGLRTHAPAVEPAATTPRWDPGEASVARLLRMLALERRPVRVPPVPGSALAHGCLAMPVTAGQAMLGYLLVLDPTNTADPDDGDLIIASYAATLFALTLAREQTTLELGLRYRGTVVDSLVCGHFLDQQDARRKAAELGIGDSQPFHVAVARLQRDGTSPAASSPDDDREAEQLMSRLAASAQSPSALRGAELVMIVPEPREATRPADPGSIETPLAVLARLLAGSPAGQEITCGVSEATTEPGLAPQALRQAEQAIELGTRLGRAGQLIRYEDLGIYRLLLQIGDMNQLWRFAKDVLGPLIDYDAVHKADLIGTLSAYLSHHESPKQAARVLRVHVNTVAYRVQRIEQLTSLDLAGPEDRLLAHVAVKIIMSQGGGGGHPGPASRPVRNQRHHSHGA
jgi:sugar diacid utilization regulator